MVSPLRNWLGQFDVRVNVKTRVVTVPTNSPWLALRSWLVTKGVGFAVTPSSWLLVRDAGALLGHGWVNHHEAVPLLPELPQQPSFDECFDSGDVDLARVLSQTPQPTQLGFVQSKDSPEFKIETINVVPTSRGRGMATALAVRVADTWAGGRRRVHGGGFSVGGEAWAVAMCAAHPEWSMPGES